MQTINFFNRLMISSGNMDISISLGPIVISTFRFPIAPPISLLKEVSRFVVPVPDKGSFLALGTNKLFTAFVQRIFIDHNLMVRKNRKEKSLRFLRFGVTEYVFDKVLLMFKVRDPVTITFILITIGFYIFIDVLFQQFK